MLPRHSPFTPTYNQYQYILDNLNRTLSAVIVHLHIDNPQAKARHPKPSIEDLNALQSQITAIISQFNEPYIKR